MQVQYESGERPTLQVQYEFWGASDHAGSIRVLGSVGGGGPSWVYICMIYGPQRGGPSWVYIRMTYGPQHMGARQAVGPPMRQRVLP
eukprot:158430-Chlamydomonas_euryale.AAC.1